MLPVFVIELNVYFGKPLAKYLMPTCANNSSLNLSLYEYHFKVE